jgi:predicted dehydrogenase
VSSIGVGVIGLGFMGRVHVASYAPAHLSGLSSRLVAVADPRSDQMRGAGAGNLKVGEDSLELGLEVRRYASSEELIRDPEIELVSICTPTDTHADLAVATLSAGKHVLLEKPVATSVGDVRRVAEAAARAGRLIMPAMCMRFWSGWTWLKQRVDEGARGELGRLVGVTFTRMGAPPSWSPEFYLDRQRSGGALFDLHIHDADFVQYCFGLPDSVVSQGTVDHLTTIYRYPPGRGPVRVVAEGGWGAAAGFPFRMRYTAQFEKGTADFELGRGAPLGPLLLARGGKGEVVPLPSEGAYHAEVRHMLEAVAAFKAGAPVKLRATIEDAERVTRMLHAERRSLETGQAELVA